MSTAPVASDSSNDLEAAQSVAKSEGEVLTTDSLCPNCRLSSPAEPASRTNTDSSRPLTDDEKTRTTTPQSSTQSLESPLSSQQQRATSDLNEHLPSPLQQQALHSSSPSAIQVELQRQVVDLEAKNMYKRCSPGWHYFYSTDGSFHTVINPAKEKKFVIGDYVSIEFRKGYLVRLGYHQNSKEGRAFMSAWYVEVIGGEKLAETCSIVRLSEICTAIRPPNVCELTLTRLAELQKSVRDSLDGKSELKPKESVGEKENETTANSEASEGYSGGEMVLDEKNNNASTDESIPPYLNTRSKSPTVKKERVQSEASSTAQKKRKPHARKKATPQQQPQQTPQFIPVPVPYPSQVEAQFTQPVNKKMKTNVQCQSGYPPFYAPQLQLPPQPSFVQPVCAYQYPQQCTPPLPFVQSPYNAMQFSQQQYYHENYCPMCGASEMNCNYCANCGHKRV